MGERNALSFSTALALAAFAAPALSAAMLADRPALAAPVVTDCAPSTVLEASHGGRRVFVERALAYYDWAPNYSQSVCLNIDTGEEADTGPSCDAPTWWRTDCSGFVSEAWNLSTSYSTAWLADGGTDANGNTWATESWDALEIGDALNEPGSHIMLFTGWLDAAHSSFCVLEEADVGLTDDWGGLGCIADTESVATKMDAGFFPLALQAIPDGPAEGALEAADCTSIRGWAADFDTPDAAVTVDLYADAPAGDPSSIALGSIAASASRDDLCDLVGSCDHGFEAKTPDALFDGQPHAIFAYARGTGDGAPAALPGAATVTCEAAPPPAPNATGGGDAGGASSGTTDAPGAESGLHGTIGCAVSESGGATTPAVAALLASALGAASAAFRRRRSVPSSSRRRREHADGY